MPVRDFKKLSEAQWSAGKFLCIGLDTDFNKIPPHLQKMGRTEGLLAFNSAIIDATKDIAHSYKPNSAFYEAEGSVGFDVLLETSRYIQACVPRAPIIFDAKRADIGNTNEGYVRAVFDHLGMDAITVHPYLGREALSPFLERKEKGIIILCRTSNHGSGEFQDLPIENIPLFLHIARAVSQSWNENGNCGLVVGATYADDLERVRHVAPELPILIPGIGVQGGDLESSVRAGKTAMGGIYIASSRSILYASSGEDFADAARNKAQEFDSAIRKAV